MTPDFTTPEGIAAFLFHWAKQQDGETAFARGYRYALRTAADEICRKNNIPVPERDK